MHLSESEKRDISPAKLALSTNSQLPEDWIQKPLKEVAEIAFSGVNKKSRSDQKTVRLCNYMDVYNNDYITADMDFMTATASDREIEKFALQQGDVIITKDSEAPDDIGVPAVVVGDLDNVICGYHLALLRPNQNEIDGVFLAKELARDRVSYQFSRVANGATRFGLTTDAVRNIQVNVPPLSEQKKIARILGTWDRAIDLTERLIEAEEKRRKGLMQQLLTGKVRFGEFVQSDKTQQSQAGLIPEDWNLKRGDELATVNPRKEIVDNENLPVSFIPMASISENARIIGTHIEPYSKVSKGFTSFRDGDIIIAKITPCFENGKGALADNLNNDLGFGSTEFHVMRTKFNVNPHFLFFHTISYPFRKRGEANMTGSAGQKRVPTDFVKAYRIPLPSLPEQRKIAAVLSACDREIELLGRKLDVLKEEKKGLMQQLLMGKVRVAI